MKPWEKYQSSGKPWEKYGAPVQPSPVSGSAEAVIPHNLKLPPVIKTEVDFQTDVPDVRQDFDISGRPSVIMGSAMTGAQLGHSATQGVPNPLIKVGGPIVGGALGAFQGAMGSSVLQGEDVNTAIPKALNEAKTDATFGLLGPVLGETVTQGKRVFKRGVLGLDDQAQAAASTARGVGVDVGITDVAKSGSPAHGFRAVLGRFPYVGTPFVASNTQSKQQVASAVDDFLDTVAPHASLNDAGVDVFKASKNTFKEARGVWSSLYGRADKLADQYGKIIDTTNLHQAARNLIDSPNLPGMKTGKVKPVLTRRLKKLSKQLGGVVDTQTVGPDGKPFQVQDLNERITVSELRALQKEINGIGRELNLKGVEVPEFAALRKASEDALQNMDLSKISQEQAQEVVDAYALANKTFSDGMRVFENPTAQKVGRVDKNAFKPGFAKAGSLNADELLPAIFDSRSVQDMKDLRALVGDESFKKAARVYLNNAFKRSFKETKTGVTLDTDALRDALGLSDKSKASAQAFGEMMRGTGADASTLRDLMKTADLIEDITLPSQFLARQAVFSGFRSLLGGAAVVTGLKIAPMKTLTAIGVARYTSHFLTNPKHLDWALSILESGEVTKQTSTNFLRLVGALEKEEVKERESQGVFLESDVPSVPEQ